MYSIDISYVKNALAANQTVFARGENIYLLGQFQLIESHVKTGTFTYIVKGNKDYEVVIVLNPKSGIQSTSCTCPYPHDGCKHVVASCLDIIRRIQEDNLIELSRVTPQLVKSPAEVQKEKTQGSKGRKLRRIPPPIPASAEALMHNESSEKILSPFLSPEEIRSQALQSRIDRASSEPLKLIAGNSYIGVHQVQHLPYEPYTITIYDPVKRLAHCNCPDYAVNNLQTCKHLIFAFTQLDKQYVSEKNLEGHIPFVHVTWNSIIRKPVCYIPQNVDPALSALLRPLFDDRGEYRLTTLVPLFEVWKNYEDPTIVGELTKKDTITAIKFDNQLLEKIDEVFFKEHIATLEKTYSFDMSFLHTELYPYQREGIKFAVFRRSAILADEMGLGKTIQAIAVACLKKEIFGIERVLIICPASLKRQWKQEIEKFTQYKALLLEGTPAWRRHTILHDTTFFKIMNYELILRDLDTIKLQPPDLVILDEAQRIKNFSTKTHQAIKQIPRSHSLVLTGTPLENKLEDVYSIVQFCNPETLSPLWAFAAQHYRLSRDRGNKILGYHNLDLVHEKITPLLLRRTKAEVFDSLPEITRSRMYLEPTDKQIRQHQGYLQSLQRIVRKKVLTPMDMQRMQKLLLGMRMVCDASCLVDDTVTDTSSPKLQELESLLRDVVVAGGRKIIIFSEWTSMTALVGAVVSKVGLNFVEFSGKVPVKKRQVLIDEFRNNPSCMVFIATDAGGVGLNLQNCDFLVNIELPWNPAKLHQRIGRIHRIGQKSNKIHVIDMVMSQTIEEKIATGLGLKQDLFDAVFSGNTTEVDFNREGRSQFLHQINTLLETMDTPTHPSVDEIITKPELDETDPHYLNPQILSDTNTSDEIQVVESHSIVETEQAKEVDLTEEYLSEELKTKEHGQAPTVQEEQLQTVLNQGLVFLNTLAQMSTGKPLFSPGTSNPIEIDSETGEVVMRFKML